MKDFDDIKEWIHLVITNAWIQKWDKYLIAQRSKTDPYKPGYRWLVGWKLDYKEWYDILQNNVKKEIQEEVWIEVDNIKLIGNFMTTTKNTIIYTTFHCLWKSGEARALEDTEDIKWLNLEELKLFDEPNIFKEFLPYIS